MYLRLFVLQTEWMATHRTSINHGQCPVLPCPWPAGPHEGSEHPPLLPFIPAFFCFLPVSWLWTLNSSLTSASLEYYSPSFFCYWTPELPYHLCFSGTSGSRDHFGLRPKLQVQLRSIGSYPFVIYGGDALLFPRLVLLCLLLLPISSSCFWFFFFLWRELFYFLLKYSWCTIL